MLLLLLESCAIVAWMFLLLRGLKTRINTTMLIFVFVFVLYCIVTPTFHAGKERDDISKSAHLLRHHLHHPLHPGGLLRHGGSHVPYERLQPCHDCRLHVSLRLELHQVCQCGYVCVCVCVGVCVCVCVCVFVCVCKWHVDCRYTGQFRFAGDMLDQVAKRGWEVGCCAC